MFNTEHVIRWRLILEEYVSDIEYIAENKNIEEYDQPLLPKGMNLNNYTRVH